MATAMAAMLLLGACNDDTLYLHSVDVNSSGWTSADTLVFPVHIDAKASPYNPLEKNFPYCMALTVRYERTYPLANVPIHIHYDRDHQVTLPLANEEGFPDGEQCGTLCQMEVDVASAFFIFPDSGDYQIKVWPDSTAHHILSLTATLE